MENQNKIDFTVALIDQLESSYLADDNSESSDRRKKVQNLKTMIRARIYDVSSEEIAKKMLMIF